MAKSEQEKKQTRRIVFSIAVLAVITLALVGSSLAWFVTNRKTEVNSFTLTTDRAYNLQVSPTEEDDWTYDLRMDDSMRLRPVVGNGLDFFTATFAQQADEEGGSIFHSVVSGYEKLSTDNVGKYVLQTDFKVTIEQDCPLSVEDLTLQMSATEKNVSFETSPDGIKRSGLLGAVRLALFIKDGNAYKPCLYWMPDPETLLTETDGVYTLGTRTSDFESFTLQNRADATQETVFDVPTNGDSGGLGGTGKVTTDDGVIVYYGGTGGDIGDYRTVKCNLDPDNSVLTQLVGRTETEFRLVVWVDGNDNECKNVLMGGTVQVGMRLKVDIPDE